MQRWMELGIMVLIALVGLGATCVDQGRVARPGEDAGTPPPVTEEDEFDDGLYDSSTNTASSHPRGTVTSGLDIPEFRSVIFRADGSQEDVADEELFLAAGNRAVIYLSVMNASGGWVPINFELCVDSTDVLAVIDPSAEPPETGVVLEDPCAVRYEDGQWPIVEQSQTVAFRAGTVEAKPQAGGGYMTVYFRADFPDLGVLDLFEFTVPYRVLPSNETKAMYVPRRVIKRRITIDLP